MRIRHRLYASTLLGLLLAGLCPTASAQPIEPQPPVILVPGQDGSSEPIHVRAVDVDVRISGFLAETTLVMSFHNPNPRQLEGQLVFPLPEGATIAGFGLDVGGELVDGVVVERQAARVAFETEVRRRIDPGLAEWVQGSTFRTRVYPIPAEGGRTVKVTYVSDLGLSEGSVSYRLPLAFRQPLERFHVRLAVLQGATEPSIEGGALENLRFDSWESQFVAETTLTDVTPAEDLVIAVPRPAENAVVVERDESGDHFFAVQDLLPELAASGPALAPERVALVFDVSGSRADADVERELSVVRAWAEANAGAEIELLLLRDVLEAAGRFEPGPDRAERLIERIQSEPFDGGTDLSLLRFSADPGELDVVGEELPHQLVDYYLLVSDGLGSLGEPDLAPGDVPVYSLTSSTGANHGLLRYLAEQSGGSYANLQRLSEEEALAALGTTPLRLMSVEYPPDAVADLEMASLLPHGGRMLLTGRLLQPEATLGLSYGFGDTVLHRSEIALSQAGASDYGLVPRYWAQQRLARLALTPKNNRLDLLRLGREHNLVTPFTSYIVLETLQQHLEHGIPPAPSRGEMLAAFNEQIEAREQTRTHNRLQKLERVAGLWAERVRWWEDTPGEAAVPSVEPPATPSEGEVLEGVLRDSGDGDDEESTSDRPRERADHDATSRSEVVESGPVQAAPPGEPPALEEEAWEAVEELEPESLGLPGPAGIEVDEAAGGFAGGESSGRDLAARGAADTGGEAGETDSTTALGAAIAVEEWRPDTPYLDAMEAAGAAEAYAVYLEQREEHGRQPAFYLDAASLLFQLERDAEARRVLTNIAEMGLEDARLLRIVAYKLQERGDLDVAIRIFERVYQLRPEEPQSLRDLALALTARADRLAASEDLDDTHAPVADWVRAINLLSEVVLMDTDRFYYIEIPALMEANRTLAALERWHRDVLGGETPPEVDLPDRLRQNLDCDLRVTLRWDTDLTDMDLWVNEPSGERAWYQNHNTASGGLFGNDFTGGYGPEEYAIRHAPDGGYLIQVNYYGSRQQSLTGGTTVQVDLVTDFGRPTERRHTATMRLTTRRETVDIGTIELGAEEPTLDVADGVQQSSP